MDSINLFLLFVDSFLVDFTHDYIDMGRDIKPKIFIQNFVRQHSGARREHLRVAHSAHVAERLRQHEVRVGRLDELLRRLAARRRTRARAHVGRAPGKLAPTRVRVRAVEHLVRGDGRDVPGSPAQALQRPARAKEGRFPR